MNNKGVGTCQNKKRKQNTINIKIKTEKLKYKKEIKETEKYVFRDLD